MRTYRIVVDAAKKQLFARVPKNLKSSFGVHLFSYNTARFFIMSTVLVLMDAGLLIAYLLTRFGAPVNKVYLAVFLVKITLMILSALLLSRLNGKSYNPGRFLQRHLDILYPLLHVVGEIALFITGPQDLGAFARLLAVPFVVGSIPILHQAKSLVLLLSTHLFFFFYMDNTAYGAFIMPAPTYYNFWVVVFACSLIISFSIYSWFVNVFTTSTKADQAKDSLSRLNSRLDYMARHDALTSLYNRRGFNQYMEKTWQQHSREETASVLIIDIDYFKRYNDRYGHLEGDRCLKLVSRAIASVLKNTLYMLARYGGEEFIAIAYGQRHEKMLGYAKAIREAVLDLQLPHPDSEASTYVTVSIGLSTQVIGQLDGSETLINWADECLYYAKRSGRNRVIHTNRVRGGYTDIYGVSLTSSRLGAQSLSRTFNDADTVRILRDIGGNCSFVYYSNQKRLFFSRQAVELFEIPNSVAVYGRQHLGETLQVATADRETLHKVLDNCLSNREPSFTVEVQFERHAGHPIPVSVTGQVIYDENGRAAVAFGSIYSLSHMLEYNRFLLNQSMTNGLTLLPNRDKLRADLRDILGAAPAKGTLLFLDINHFNEINGRYSHSIGDKLLREVAYQLSKMASSDCPVFNYDVDQFVYLLKDSGYDEAKVLIERILRFFSNVPMRINAIEITVSFAIAALLYSTDTADIDQLFMDMDMAIQSAKMEHNAPYILFDEAEKAETMARQALRYTIKQAIENDFQGFRLYYQPIVDATTKQCVGAEALLRWQDPQKLIISPDQFIPMLEQDGLMPLVDQWVLRSAAAQCRRWIEAGAGQAFFVHVNRSPQGLATSANPNEIRALLQSNGLQPHNLIIEITETISIMGQSYATDMLNSFAQEGIQVAIDDFGTGYSSLSYLTDLPVKEIKIDRFFVRDIATSHAARDFLVSIIMMVKSMGFCVCVEGIETAAQAECLSKTVVDYLQGFYFGVPCPAETFAQEHLGQG